MFSKITFLALFFRWYEVLGYALPLPYILYAHGRFTTIGFQTLRIGVLADNYGGDTGYLFGTLLEKTKKRTI